MWRVKVVRAVVRARRRRRQRPHDAVTLTVLCHFPSAAVQLLARFPRQAASERSNVHVTTATKKPSSHAPHMRRTSACL